MLPCCIPICLSHALLPRPSAGSQYLFYCIFFRSCKNFLPSTLLGRPCPSCSAPFDADLSPSCRPCRSSNHSHSWLNPDPGSNSMSRTCTAACSCTNRTHTLHRRGQHSNHRKPLFWFARLLLLIPRISTRVSGSTQSHRSLHRTASL